MASVWRPAGALFLLAFMWLAWRGLRSINNQPEGCNMTYMYPNFIKVNLTSEGLVEVGGAGYNLFLYIEGWQNVDHEDSLLQLFGVPVLFIPGNAGSFRQVRSLASESHRQWESGRLQSEATGKRCEYTNRLDWFAVDFLEEYSALDSRILRDQTKFVTLALNKVLTLYQQAAKVRKQCFEEQRTRPLPNNVIVIAHSMGGLAARAALFHPDFREGSVGTIITLASPHRSPPAPLQVSGSLFYSDLNRKWQEGFAPNGPLSDVIVVSMSGGSRDTQVRTPLTRLDGIVPPNGFSVSASAVPDVWQETDHQVVVWCNQLVVKLAKTLLLLVDPATGQVYKSRPVRLKILAVHLRSTLPEALGWLPRGAVGRQSFWGDFVVPGQAKKREEGDMRAKRGRSESNVQAEKKGNGCSSAKAGSGHGEDGVRACLKEELGVRATTIEAQQNKVSGTLLIEELDRRRRWFASKRDGSGRFVMVTNLEPGSQFRVRTWEAVKGDVETERNCSAEHASSDVSSTGSGQRQTISAEGDEGLEVTSARSEYIDGQGESMGRAGGDLLVEGEEMTLHFARVPLGKATEYDAAGWVLNMDGADLQGVDWISIEVARKMDAFKPLPLLVAQLGRPTTPVHLGARFLLRGLFSAQPLVLPKAHTLWTEITPPLPLFLLPLHLALESLRCDRQGVQDVGPSSENACNSLCFSPLLVAWDSSIEQERIWLDLQAAIVQTDGFSLGGRRTQSRQPPLALLSDTRCTYTLTIRPAYKPACFRFLAINAQYILSFAVALVMFDLAAQSNAVVPSLSSGLVKNSSNFQTQFLGSLIALVIACSAYRYSHSSAAEGLVALSSYSLSLLLAFGLVTLLAGIQAWCVWPATICITRWRKRSPTPGPPVVSPVCRSILAVFSSVLCLVYHPGAALLVVLASQLSETALSAADHQSLAETANKDAGSSTGASAVAGDDEVLKVAGRTKTSPWFTLQLDSPFRGQHTGPLQRQSARLLLTLLNFVVTAPSLAAVLVRAPKLRIPALVDSSLVLLQVIETFVLSDGRTATRVKSADVRQERIFTVAYVVLGLVACCDGVLGAPYGVKGSFAGVAILQFAEGILANFGTKVAPSP